MTPEGKKRIVVVASVLIIGTTAYFLWKHFKGDKGAPKDKFIPGASDSPTATTITTQGPVNVAPPATPSGGGRPTSTADIKAFQTYANGKGASPKLTVDGQWGPKSQAAWNKYGAGWKPTSPANYDPGYVAAWTKAKENGQIAFIYNGRVYETATGRVVRQA